MVSKVETTLLEQSDEDSDEDSDQDKDKEENSIKTRRKEPIQPPLLYDLQESLDKGKANDMKWAGSGMSRAIVLGQAVMGPVPSCVCICVVQGGVCIHSNRTFYLKHIIALFEQQRSDT